MLSISRPSARAAATVSCAPPALISQPITLAPWRANISAQPRPMPAAMPVTSAIFPASLELSMSSLQAFVDKAAGLREPALLFEPRPPRGRASQGALGRIEHRRIAQLVQRQVCPEWAAGAAVQPVAAHAQPPRRPQQHRPMLLLIPALDFILAPLRHPEGDDHQHPMRLSICAAVLRLYTDIARNTRRRRYRVLALIDSGKLLRIVDARVPTRILKRAIMHSRPRAARDQPRHRSLARRRILGQDDRLGHAVTGEPAMRLFPPTRIIQHRSRGRG